ncbi:sigma-54 dependent transcriptional regulator [Shewanella corallii]|uniref:Sigma-54 dependent transcriptional regulator n=1 Tax=Shewanella corallii TaxID=560080 RepID=A0ABT0NCF9_9GAMM|nr:sigma-54 dependent transcriptional regulator [Shewanella corallii]MCL2915785.1 sigma-54 dependent transcriptional regulator [Shewanella corallii]
MEKTCYFEATQRLCASLQLEKSLEHYFHYMKQKLPIDGIFMNLFQPEQRQIQFIAHANNESAQALEQCVPLTEEMCQVLSQPDRPVIRIINHIETDGVTFHVAPRVFPDIQSLILMRMICDDTHLGVVGYYSKTPNSFRAIHADLIESHMHPLALITAFNLQGRNLLAQNQQLAEQNDTLKRSLEVKNGVIGADAGLKRVMEQVQAIAHLDTSVLILGETGVGKEVIANAVHEHSTRAGKPFIKVNCGAIPDSLLDSELFGYEKGAFTGAEQRKQGYFEQADGGTIFLDEIGELPLSAQVRLLRVLQNSTITRVGGYESIELNIRVIAATHRDLQHMVQDGEFRQDLWYRLAIFPIQIPPLRQRTSDIPLLAQFAVEKMTAKFNLPNLPRIHSDQLSLLSRYPWPGNVREMMNVIERAVIQHPEGPLDFSFLMPSEPEVVTCDNQQVIIDPSRAGDKLVPLELMMQKYISHALKVCGGKVYGSGGAAEMLAVNPNTLRSKMKKLGIQA